MPTVFRKQAKYSNKKVMLEGIAFDSKAEARRWQELQLLVQAGEISELRRQVPLVLAPGVRLAGSARARPAVRLVVDFCYIEKGSLVWEDAKGFETPISLLKRHLAKALLNIDVRIV